MSTFGFYPEMPQVGSVPNPASGFARLYLHSDGTVRRRNPDGSESILQVGFGDSSVVNGVTYFGDGSDGDVTISSNTTLVRTMYYNNLTINAGVSLTVTNNTLILVKNTLTLLGNILNTGTNSSGAGGASGGGGGSVGGSGANTSNGVNGTLTLAGNLGSALGGSGGKGGDGQNVNGLSGGTATVTQPNLAYMNSVYGFARITTFLGSPVNSGGGGGGAGGFSTRTIAGNIGSGGGGGGGGVIFIAANKITGSGIISAKGGNGGNATQLTTSDPATGAGGGGGGGGGGAIILLSTVAGTFNPSLGTGNLQAISLSVEGGIGGLSTNNTGAPAQAGANGSHGRVIFIQV